jgi:hypothetical protein
MGNTTRSIVSFTLSSALLSSTLTVPHDKAGELARLLRFASRKSSMLISHSSSSEHCRSCVCPNAPRGRQGKQGSEGPKGHRGRHGKRGARGATGATGNCSECPRRRGARGPRGHTGRRGIGVTGPTGAAGRAGARGSTGPTGNTGPKGLRGGTGNTGPMGNTGGNKIRLPSPGCPSADLVSGHIFLNGAATQVGPGWTATGVSPTGGTITFTDLDLQNTQFPTVFTGETADAIFISGRTPGTVSFTSPANATAVDFTVLECPCTNATLVNPNPCPPSPDISCCGGACTNTTTDFFNCGSCGNSCNSDFSVCCPGSSTATVGNCCSAGLDCCRNSLAATCCDPTIGQTCCNPPGFAPHCCDEDSPFCCGNACCGGKCCTDITPPYCCDTSENCCFGICCSQDATCCTNPTTGASLCCTLDGGVCCFNPDHCCENGGESCCGAGCCNANQQCCGGEICCDTASQQCCSGPGITTPHCCSLNQTCTPDLCM